MARPICVLVCALGGEGGGVLAEWLYGAAVRAGHAAQATSIPGVAQRTGATTYYLEVSAVPTAAGVPTGVPADAPRPVFSLSPVPGAVDLLVSSELLEALRQAGSGFVSRARTRVITSTTRALTVAEKMAQADGRADSARLVAALHKAALGVDLLDANALAREAGTAVSAVLLGAIAASGVLPLPRSAYEEAIRAAGKGVKASLAGFALAFDAVQVQRGQHDQARAWIDAAAPKPRPQGQALRRLARERVAAYQDEAYAQLFDARLAKLDAAAAAAGAGLEVADEAARWLALWMCFDDIVQVAALKLAASRQARVRREVAADAGDLVKVFDHFKPGVPELAGLLPPAWAARLVAWDRRRVAAGREPWALPVKLGTHGLRGALALRAAASLKGWRRRGGRFREEQALIERWLAAVQWGTGQDTALGLELARCGALVKGYGSTNERGKDNLLHIVEHLAATGAAAVRAAREAALADDAGRALDATLAAHGAPARAPREQVVRWFKRRPATSGS